MTDFFSTTIAPSCFALLSEKMRERQLALSHLKEILPRAVNQGEICSADAVKIVKSFLDWLNYETRTSRKSPATNSLEKLQVSVKELKWVIVLMDNLFPRIDLSDVVLEIIDKLYDVMDCTKNQPFSEISHILGNNILSKSLYLKILSESKLTSRFNRLLVRVCKVINDGEQYNFIKILAYLAISIPNPLKSESFIYEQSHEAFLNWLSVYNVRPDSALLPSVFGAINSLLLDGYHHSMIFHSKYYLLVLNILKNTKNIALAHKIYQFLLFKGPEGEILRTQLIDILLNELLNPVICFIYDTDPAQFCVNSIKFHKYYYTELSFTELTHYMFLKLCSQYLSITDKSIHVPFILFTGLKNQFKNLRDDFNNIPQMKQKNIHYWLAVLKFHINSMPVNFDHGSLSFSWYKVFYICNNPGIFAEFQIKALDNFVLNSLENQISFSDFYIFDAIFAYFQLRFYNLTWTKSAQNIFELFLSAILFNISENQDLIYRIFSSDKLLYSLLTCLFFPLFREYSQYQWPCTSSSDGLKSYDCALILNSQERLTRYLSFNFDPSLSSPQQPLNSKNDIPSVYKSSLSSFFQNFINTITESEIKKFPKNSLVYFFKFLKSLTVIRSNSNEFSIFHDAFLNLPEREILFLSGLISKFIPSFARYIAQNVEITQILSEIIPVLQNQSQNSSQNVDENISFFEDNFVKTVDSNSSMIVSLITSEIFRETGCLFMNNSSTISYLLCISETLYFAFENSSDEKKKTDDITQILQDWDIFMNDIRKAPNSKSTYCNQKTTFTWTLQNLTDFLQKTRPFFNLPTSLYDLRSYLRCNDFDPILILPDSSILKSLIAPEQWITILLVLFEAPRNMNLHIVTWFLKMPTDLFKNEILLLFLKTYLNTALLNDFLLHWISLSKLLADFPFGLIRRCKDFNRTADCVADFLFTSPHLPIILSQFTSFNSLVQFSGYEPSACTQIVSKNFSFLLASLFLNESSDIQLLLKSAIDPLMNTLAQQSFVDLVVIVLSHGQYYPWNRVISGLQQLARLFKLSAAADFSEVFNPIHSIQIIRDLVPKLKNLAFLTKFITQVPVIFHHPQLIKIVFIALKTRIKGEPVFFEVDDLLEFIEFIQKFLDHTTFRRELFHISILLQDHNPLAVHKIASMMQNVSIFKIFTTMDCSPITGIAEFGSLLHMLSIKHLESIISRLTASDDQLVLASVLSRFDRSLLNPASLNFVSNNYCEAYSIDDHLHFAPTFELISTILSFAHHQIFVLNNLDSTCCELIYRLLNVTHVNGNRKHTFESLTHLSSTVKEDLKMFILPLGSKVICFNKNSITGSNLLDVDNKYFSKPIHSNKDADELLRRIVFNFLHVYDQSISFIAEICTTNIHTKILHHILPFLLQSASCQPLIPKYTKFLIHLHQQSSDTDLIENILHLILELSVVGPNFVDSIIRLFNNDQDILQQLSTKKPTTAIYIFSLLQESSRCASELDLSALAQIYSSIGPEAVDYMEVAKQRLRKFDTSLPELWDNDIDTVSISVSAKENDLSDYFWLQRKWFDENDFYFHSGISLSINQFTRQSLKLNWLHSVVENSTSPSLSTSQQLFSNDKIEWNCIELIKTCSFDVLSPNSISSLSKLLVSTNPDRIDYQTVALLPHVSQRYEQMSKFILTDMSAKILWNQKKYDLALETAKTALHIFPEKLSDERKAMLLLQIGEWAAFSKSDRPSYILSNYFDKAMSVCETVSKSQFSTKSLAQIHLKVARFVDEQYQQIKESDDFKTRSKLLEESRESLAAARLNKNVTSATTASDRRQIEISVSTLRSQYDLDMQEYSERLRSLNSFLLKSVQNYIYALTYSSDLTENEQMAVTFRLCALWFCHADFSAVNDLINTIISSGSGSKSRECPSLHLFLPLIYQLAARASYDRTAANPNHFQRTLMRLLVQLTINHPFDCIYQLIALRSGSSDSSMLNVKKRKLLDAKETSSLDPNQIDRDTNLRSAASGIIIDQTRKIPSISSYISAVETLCDAYVELASHPPPPNIRSTTTCVNFDKNLKIAKLLYPLPSDSALKHVPIPTAICKDEKFAGFMDGFKLMSGINLPKQIDVITSSGSHHSQLVKGNDDVRQDAVMEQVFLRVNRLLQADCEARRRKLTMRTYRVIPLRPLVGLLEWVSDSTPLATYLTDAHERLRPGDISPSKCRELLKAEAERAGSTVQSKLNVLLRDIGNRFRPVLRNFFFEHFGLATWWEAKQAYTRSMATASIVGWIVGLGDRHGMNILLDKKTGEVVHIDLNMIFEAGRTLRVPERVPFRLTSDCVDGMGPEGIGLDGPFKQHAISTLMVLRKEHALLMIILDVFKYDPLQKWTGMAKALKNSTLAKPLDNVTSSSTSDVVSKEAQRALLRIKEKLEGREEGTVLSEAGHVSYLIQTATDPELLCQMYFGWQAYF